jgi:hypothetical protein
MPEITGRSTTAINRQNRTSVLARPTEFERADAINIRIPIEGAGEWLKTSTESA